MGLFCLPVVINDNYTILTIVFLRGQPRSNEMMRITLILIVPYCFVVMEQHLTHIKKTLKAFHNVTQMFSISITCALDNFSFFKKCLKPVLLSCINEIGSAAMKDEQIDSIEVDVSLYFLNLQQCFPLNFCSYHYQVYRIILVKSRCLLLVFT